MVFSSIFFLYLFLPVTCVGYFLLPARARNLWLFLISLLFYGWGEPVYISIMLFSTVFDYCNGRLIHYFDQNGKRETFGRAFLVLSVVGNLAILGFFKYSDFFLETVHGVFGLEVSPIGLALPIGISFYTFQTMSYTIDVYRRQTSVQKNIIAFGMYVSMFPQLIAGPIVRYQTVAEQIDHRQFTPEGAAKGMQRFLIGLGKKVLFANQIGVAFDELSGLHNGDVTFSIAWLMVLCFTFQIYFDFSGYSDMAIGLGMIFGFSFPENFRYPYESYSITEFWRRWHMTLSTWFREYVYIPLGGNRKGVARQIINLAIVWFLTGLWHGAAWNFVLWGIYYFVLLVLEKFVLGKVLSRIPRPVRQVLTMIFVVFGWGIFAFTEPEVLGQWMRALCGIGVPFGNALALYEWRRWVLFLLVLLVASTSLPKRLVCRIVKREGVRFGLGCMFALVLLVVSTAFLVSGSYNPFLYFRF